MFLKHAFASLIVVGAGAAVAHSVAGVGDRASVLAQAPPSAPKETDHKKQREERAKGSQEHTNQERARAAREKAKADQEKLVSSCTSSPRWSSIGFPNCLRRSSVGGGKGAS